MVSKISKIVKNNKFFYSILKPAYDWYCYKKDVSQNKGNSKLHRLGVKYKTDKVDKWHTFNGLSYLDIYEKYFYEFRNKPINILEIGVRGGNSVKIWKKFFKKGKVIGIDINPNCIKHSEKRIEIFIGNQNNASFLDNVLKKLNGVDIIIDDGSHINELSIFSFNHLFKYLNKNGVYIIEDLATSYENLNEVEDLWEDELKANKRNGVDLKNERKDLDNFFSDIIHNVDKNNNEVKAIHFWTNIAVILKS